MLGTRLPECRCSFTNDHTDTEAGRMTRDEALDQLREQLLKLNPSGIDGFEGLIAHCLTDLTGLSMRLAKSGSQFGRDGRTAAADFSVAMEAKRYTDDLRLE